ncbi:hypothetical protein NKR23_g10933 [Pleurostoma richardsiae]|uniref:Homeobox domain-containing protein n=1 Tax=Pleurostoma richardsiae TaxID=41990 RepID=A0AA38R8W7_9PEZI|nr:hypothetical protein NKR23_g10933 [Pleurostoma richardsiae]
MGPPRCDTTAVEDLGSRVAQLQLEVDTLISAAASSERVARSACDDEVPALRDQISRNEEEIQRLQQENEAAENKIVELQNIYEAARAQNRKVLTLFGRARKTPSLSGTSREQTPTNDVRDGAETEAATSRQHHGTEHDRPRDSAYGTDPSPPAVEQEIRRSARQRRPPQHLTSGPLPTRSHPLRRSRSKEVVPTSPCLPATKKRKRDTGRHARPQDAGTRASVTHDNKIGNIDEDGKRRRKTSRTRTIEFDEVFQGGRAKYKHKIIEHPESSGQWFILRCDSHSTHFGYNAVTSAGRHLSHKEHGSLLQGKDIAVQELGVRVLGCDAAKAKQNNDVFEVAIRDGYKVLKGDDARDSRRSHTQTTPMTTRGRGARVRSFADEEQPKPFDGVTDPVVGELYLGYWRSRSRSSSSGWYAVVLLPLGDFEAVGISGSISETRLAKGHIPICYISDKKTRTILGWAERFEDGGPDVAKRKFPVMYFDDDQAIPSDGLLPMPSPDSLAWLPADQLRPFGQYGPEDLPARGYDATLSFLEMRAAARVASQQREEVPTAAASGAHLSEASVPRGTSHGLGIVDHEARPQPKASAGPCIPKEAPARIITGVSEFPGGDADSCGGPDTDLDPESDGDEDDVAMSESRTSQREPEHDDSSFQGRDKERGSRTSPDAGEESTRHNENTEMNLNLGRELPPTPVLTSGETPSPGGYVQPWDASKLPGRPAQEEPDVQDAIFSTTWSGPESLFGLVQDALAAANALSTTDAVSAMKIWRSLSGAEPSDRTNAQDGSPTRASASAMPGEKSSAGSRPQNDPALHWTPASPRASTAGSHPVVTGPMQQTADAAVSLCSVPDPICHHGSEGFAACVTSHFPRNTAASATADGWEGAAGAAKALNNTLIRDPAISLIMNPDRGADGNASFIPPATLFPGKASFPDRRLPLPRTTGDPAALRLQPAFQYTVPSAPSFPVSRSLAPLSSVDQGHRLRNLKSEELEQLEAEFQRNPQPDMQVRKDLATAFQLDVGRVSRWFQNRRSRAAVERRNATVNSKIQG